MMFLSSVLPRWLLLGTLVNQACGLSLLEALAEYPELSTLSKRVIATPVLASLLGGADGFTFFAPTNTAIDNLLKAQSNTTTDAAFQAIIQYSLIKGGFPRMSFTNESQFVPSNLVDAKYSNVTGGQVLELVENDGRAQVISGNRSVSTLTTSDIVCAGGIIHIVDQVLSLPAPTVNAITFAKLSYFVSILTRGGYLSRAKNQYVHEQLDARDVTYFIPNTAGAVSKFNEMAKAWSDDDLKRNFQYHVVPRYLGYSDSFKNGTSLKTAEGTNLTITMMGGDVYVNAAKVVTTDILVANGVIHVIDSLLDRFNTTLPTILNSSSNRTSESTSSTTPTPTPTPIETQTQPPPSSTTTPTTSALPPPPPSQPSTANLTLKVALGASLSGAAIFSFIALFLFLRHRSNNKSANNSQRDSGVWDGHSMSTSPSDPKRYFVNNGSVQMHERERERERHTQSVSPMGMVPVTNLEITGERDAATRYHYQGKMKRVPSLPVRSPSRPERRAGDGHGERSYF